MSKKSILTKEMKEKILTDAADLQIEFDSLKLRMEEVHRKQLEVWDAVRENVNVGVYMVDDYELRVFDNGQVFCHMPNYSEL
ncbi:MAG: hypothetical protein QM500_04085 [Methylococcales bacterium]